MPRSAVAYGAVADAEGEDGDACDEGADREGEDEGDTPQGAQDLQHAGESAVF